MGCWVLRTSRAIAQRLGIRPTKTLGQNFVIDANTVRRIVRLAEVGPDDVVLEVGPGLGSLTLGLLDVARRVVAVEIDPVLAAELPQHGGRATAGPRGDCRAGSRWSSADALRLTEVPGPPPTALVANLPYNVAVPVLLTLLEAAAEPAAGSWSWCRPRSPSGWRPSPGRRTYGVPSVKAAWYAEVHRAGSVGRAVFWPVPNVDSGLVALTRREPPASAGRTGRRLRLHRRGVRPAPQDAAVGAGRLGRVGRGRDGRAAGRRHRRDVARRAADGRRLRGHRRRPSRAT